MIGVVGEGDTGGLLDRLEQGEASVVVGAAEPVIDDGPSVVVAAGEPALVDLVAAGVDAPVLVVGAVEGIPSVPYEAAARAAEGLLTGAYGTTDRRLLSVTAAGERVGPAAFDAMLVRAQPGRISEYGLAAGETTARFRADGVVVATPAGSHGYARAAGGPRLAAGTAAVAVVPVAPFGFGAPTWVLDADAPIRISVERDEGDVALLVDGRTRRQLAGRSAVTLQAGGTLPLVEPPDG